MKKFLALFLPLLIVLSLTGCLVTEYTYITPTLRKVYSVDNMAGRNNFVGYQTKIEGEWYDADENGQLTDEGKRKKQQDVQKGGEGDGGGGGC